MVDHIYACSGCETYTGADVRRSTGQLPLALIFYIFWVTLFFANKSATHVHVSHLQALCDLTLAGRYA